MAAGPFPCEYGASISPNKCPELRKRKPKGRPHKSAPNRVRRVRPFALTSPLIAHKAQDIQ
eukprot:3672061-Prorocentrum_lima.AAC.1